MEHTDWKTDWRAFVASVCESWNTGRSDRDVTNRHAHQRVTWVGKVVNVQNLYKYGRVSVEMANVPFRLNDGRIGTADYVGLNVEPSHVHEWDSVREGDQICFETEIDDSLDNPFRSSGIEWSDFRNQGYVSIATRDSQLIRVVEYGPADHSKPLPRPAPNSPDPLSRVPEYKRCWDGSEPGWMLRPYSVTLCKFTVEFDEVLDATDEQIGFVRSLCDTLRPLSDDAIRGMIGDEGRLAMPIPRECSEEELERIQEQFAEHGLGGSCAVDRSWCRLVPVSPAGIEIKFDSKSLSREVVLRMLDSGVTIEGGKKVVEWWFVDDYVRLE